MSAPRFFVNADIVPGEEQALPEEVSHHIRHVLRLKENAPVVLFTGQGGEYTAVISSISKKAVTVRVDTFSPVNRQASLEIHLGLCVLKRDGMDRVIARTTELGVSSITPVISERCTVSHSIIRKRESHWQQIAIAASEQCGLNIVPRINAAVALPEWLASCETATRIVALQTSDTIRAVSHDTGPITVLTGPEGGFSADEISGFVPSGFQPVAFGERILRAETAPIVALSVLHHRWGDFQ